MKNNFTYGSVCSGIEASHLAFAPYGFELLWNSEIAEFPSKVLRHHFPKVTNLGDMSNIPELIRHNKYDAPDMLCGGTPCQAFSLAGWNNGLADERGALTMKFIDLANAIDEVRLKRNKPRTIVLWENVEGVLNDKTNAFGNFIAGLAGYSKEIKVDKWSKSGYLIGKDRNVAWRVIDSKYYGLPQQRKRLYVVAGGKDFNPDRVLFETNNFGAPVNIYSNKKDRDLKTIFHKNKTKFQIFREYTDCLYSAYGTKWNGNAAAYNGSLYVAQNDRVRRLTPLECERLMGFPDNFTDIDGSSDTNRFQALGNSWTVPVIKWIGGQISSLLNKPKHDPIMDWSKIEFQKNNLNAKLFLLSPVLSISPTTFLNSSVVPNKPVAGSLKKIVDSNNSREKFYLSPKACAGILRRKNERDIKMNTELETIMSNALQLKEEVV